MYTQFVNSFITRQKKSFQRYKYFETLSWKENRYPPPKKKKVNLHPPCSFVHQGPACLLTPFPPQPCPLSGGRDYGLCAIDCVALYCLNNYRPKHLTKQLWGTETIGLPLRLLIQSYKLSLHGRALVADDDLNKLRSKWPRQHCLPFIAMCTAVRRFPQQDQLRVVRSVLMSIYRLVSWSRFFSLPHLLHSQLSRLYTRITKGHILLCNMWLLNHEGPINFKKIKWTKSFRTMKISCEEERVLASNNIMSSYSNDDDDEEGSRGAAGGGNKATGVI